MALTASWQKCESVRQPQIFFSPDSLLFTAVFCLYLLPLGKSSGNTFILSFVVVVVVSRYLKFGSSNVLGRYT